MNRVYTIDGAWNVAGITDNRKPVESRTFGYDPAGRLSQANGPWGTGSILLGSVFFSLVRAFGAYQCSL